MEPENLSHDKDNKNALAGASAQAGKRRRRREGHQEGPKTPDYDVTILEKLAGQQALWNALHPAKVAELKEDFVIVSLSDQPEGTTLQARISKGEFSDEPQIGQDLTVYLSDPKASTPEESDLPRASIKKALELEESTKLQKAIESGEEVPGYVVGSVKGGFSVALFASSRDEAEKASGMRAFLPHRYAVVERHEVPNIEAEQCINFIVKEFDAETGSIIVTLRPLLRAAQKVKEKAFWENATLGEVVSGVVKSVVPYGAFVDIGGADALLHLSDLSWEKHPSLKSLRVGQRVEAKIIELDKDGHKVKVGIKQLTTNPWDSVEGHYAAGSVVRGVVVALSDFGAFVKLSDGVEGLIHLSEISWQRVKHPSQRFHIGDEVEAKVLSSDGEHHRISLSTKALEANPIDALAGRFPAGTVLKTKVVAVRDFGVFVALDDKLNGLVHKNELSWTKHVEHPEELYHEGQEVEVAVLGFDPERQRVSCTIKRLTPDPWIKWRDQFAKGTRHEAVVAKVLQNGAEVELAPELIAFCPARELSSEDTAGKRPQDIVKVGQKINVEVTNSDPREHRISVSVKARANHEVQEDYQAYMTRQAKEGASKTTLADAVARKGNG